MGTFASIVTEKFGDANRDEADKDAAKAFTTILDHLSDMLDAEAGDNPFKRRIVARGLLAQIENGAGIFTQGDAPAPKAAVAAAPESKDADAEIDPYTPQNDNERNAVDAVRYHGLVIDDEGEPEQVAELRKEIIDLKSLLDDIDEALVGSSTLPTDRTIAARKTRMTDAIKALKAKPEDDQEKVTDAVADTIGAQKRLRKETVDQYLDRIDRELKAKLATAGTTTSIDTKPIADALGKPADSSVDELAKAAATAMAWETDGRALNGKIKEITGLEPKPGEDHLAYGTRGVEQGPATGTRKGRR